MCVCVGVCVFSYQGRYEEVIDRKLLKHFPEVPAQLISPRHAGLWQNAEQNNLFVRACVRALTCEAVSRCSACVFQLLSVILRF